MIRRHLGVYLTCLAVGLFLLAGSAHAGFTSVHVSGAPGDPYPDYSWNAEEDGYLGVNEVWDSSVGSDYGLNVWGETDSDPVITITKDILNSTGSTWIGYSLTLDPLDTDTFVGVPSSGGTSGGMTLDFQDDYNLLWTTPNEVLPGETVTFTFQINVPDTGAFNFSLGQSVLVPEPAACLLAICGLFAAVGLWRRS